MDRVVCYLCSANPVVAVHCTGERTSFVCAEHATPEGGVLIDQRLLREDAARREARMADDGPPQVEPPTQLDLHNIVTNAVERYSGSAHLAMQVAEEVVYDERVQALLELVP